MAERSTTELEPAKAEALAGLVDYQEGAVVSRTLHKGASGSLTVFAFDAGQELSEHSTPHDAFVQVLDGAVELTIGGAAVHAEAGGIVKMPGGVPHAVRAERRFKMLLVMLKA